MTVEDISEHNLQCKVHISVFHFFETCSLLRHLVNLTLKNSLYVSGNEYLCANHITHALLCQYHATVKHYSNFQRISGIAFHISVGHLGD